MIGSVVPVDVEICGSSTPSTAPSRSVGTTATKTKMLEVMHTVGTCRRRVCLRCRRRCDDILTNLVDGNSFYTVTDVQQEVADLRERGWTTAAIADAVGVQWPTIYRWVKGSRTPANAAGVVALLRQMKRRSVPPRRRERR